MFYELFPGYKHEYNNLDNNFKLCIYGKSSYQFKKAAWTLQN